MSTLNFHFVHHFHLVFIFVSLIARAIVECAENQEWSFCASACEPHCNEFRGKKCGPFLTLQCVFQCVCKPGYIRIAEKECIREDSPLCNGRYDPMQAFKRHKYTGVQQAKGAAVISTQ